MFIFSTSDILLYRFKYNNTNSGNLYLNISSLDISNTKKTETRSIESTGGEWQRYSVTIDAPSNTKKIVVEFGFKDSKGIRKRGNGLTVSPFLYISMSY